MPRPIGKPLVVLFPMVALVRLAMVVVDPNRLISMAEPPEQSR
jgi:hypothetical protein